MLAYHQLRYTGIIDLVRPNDTEDWGKETILSTGLKLAYSSQKNSDYPDSSLPLAPSSA